MRVWVYKAPVRVRQAAWVPGYTEYPPAGFRALLVRSRMAEYYSQTSEDTFAGFCPQIGDLRRQGRNEEVLARSSMKLRSVVAWELTRLGEPDRLPYNGWA